MDQIVQQCLDAHNEYRRKHGVPPMVISESLMEMAQNWAQTNADQCQMFHSSGRGGIGENLYCASPSLTDGQTPVDNWYNEIQNYDFGNPGFSSATGHFTQVVWKASTELGVGLAEGTDGWVYFCCNYSPAGNLMSDYEDNVFPLAEEDE
ncbi:hypothetical protein DAPPUDRAFT_61402 [Daphnia pulex]|uniref:SCP domain-containing protein n=1 Tax=Daphnia pulex TaxID=6669 RepID=E9HD00_DAPPU|nr:hypothetical protein DAPPUDRAFT_61402 [Daphnia pulex]|eukprot:EFX70384.1 hypothetical protein DAPPUDRAFT_61402 [Daphnia pulex]